MARFNDALSKLQTIHETQKAKPKKVGALPKVPARKLGLSPRQLGISPRQIAQASVRGMLPEILETAAEMLQEKADALRSNS